MGFVFEDRSFDLQHRIDDAPCLFYVILPCEERGVAGHCVADNAFVGFLLERLGMAAGDELDRLKRSRVTKERLNSTMKRTMSTWIKKISKFRGESRTLCN